MRIQATRHGPRLTGSLENPEALRVRSFLRSVDEDLDEPIELHVFGSAAVRLYAGDDGELLAQTQDIDVTGDRRVISIEGDVLQPKLRVLAAAAAGRLHFQFTNIDAFFVGPDWREQCIDASSLLGLNTLTVKLLDPRDLAVSKMARGYDKDLDDCEVLLRTIWANDRAPLRDYFYVSYPYAVEFQQRELRRSFEDIFDESFDDELVVRGQI